MTVAKYGRFEATFVANDQPAPNTKVDVTFTSPGGETTTVPGFWDGGRTWRVRFRPDVVGEWSYATATADGRTELHGQSGNFGCSELKDSRNRFLRHGPIDLSDNGHHLAHADGTPFFFLADTVWNGPMLSTTDDWNLFLNDRVEKQFTGIQFVTQAPWITCFTNREGEVAVTGNAAMPANPHFFKRIDEKMDAINDRGLLAIPVLAWAATWNETARQYNVGCFLPEDQLIEFVKYQVARYHAHHVLWILPGDGKYEGEEAEKWLRVGRAVFGEGDHAPVSLHPCGKHWPYEPFYKEAWCNVYGYQSSHSDADPTLEFMQTGPPASAWQEDPPCPVMNIEPCYEDHINHSKGEPFGATTVRQACYWSMLSSPPAGLTYGGHGIWGWAETEETPLHHPRTGASKVWREGKDLEGAFDMMRLADLFTSVSWWELMPDQELILGPSEPEPSDWVSAVRNSDGSLALVYLPAGGSVTVDTGRLADGVAGQWYDPRTGERAEASGDEGSYSAPSDHDWVLVLGK